MHRLRKLVRSQRAKLAGAKSKRPDITEKTLGFARIRQGYYQLLAEKPGEVMALRKRVENYDADLRELKQMIITSTKILGSSPPGWPHYLCFKRYLFSYSAARPYLRLSRQRSNRPRPLGAGQSQCKTKKR